MKHARQIPSLRDRIKYLAALRCLTTTLMLGSAIAVNINNVDRFDHPSYVGLTGVIVTTYVFTAALALWLRRTSRLTAAAHLSFAFDALIATAQVLMTGQLESPFAFLFVIVALLGGATMGRRGGLSAAAYAVAGLAAVTMAAFELLPLGPWLMWRPDLDDAPLFRAATLAAATVVSGLLCGLLAERLERAERDLVVSQVNLQALENLHQAILESLTSGLLTLDLGGRVVYANRAASRLTERANDALIGRDLEALGLAPAEDASGPLGRWECVFPAATDEQRVLGLSTSPLLNDAGRQMGEIVTFQDLTELRRAQRLLDQRERLSTLGRFAARMAHEIRNPLASISGAVEMLSPQLEGDDAVLMEIVLREVDRLTVLLRETLDYARPRVGDARDVALGPLLTECARLFRHEHAEITLTITCPPEVWCRVSPESLKQVFWNLWRNAAEAMDGRGALRCVVTREPGCARVQVRDDGPGVDAALRETIFEPFFTTKTHGTGLGLATVHQLLDEQGGSIELLDPDDEAPGALFELTLPAPPLATPQRPEDASSSSSSAASPSSAAAPASPSSAAPTSPSAHPPPQ